MNLNQVTVPVTVMAQSIAFYKNLGLELIVHTDDNYARFECPGGDSTFSLHRVDVCPPNPNGIWVYFEVENVDEMMSDVATKIDSQLILNMPEDKRWLWREARLRDPDGNTIIVYSAGDNRKNPPWRLH